MFCIFNSKFGAVFALIEYAIKRTYSTIDLNEWRRVSLDSNTKKITDKIHFEALKSKMKKTYVHNGHSGGILKRKKKVYLYLLHNRCFNRCYCGSSGVVAWVMQLYSRPRRSKNVNMWLNEWQTLAHHATGSTLIDTVTHLCRSNNTRERRRKLVYCPSIKPSLQLPLKLFVSIEM